MWNNTGGGFGGGVDGGDGGNDGGGGFMNTSGQFNSPAAAKKERRLQNILATTARDIQNCQEDSYSVEGSEVNMVVLVGIVRSVEISATKISYSLDDHTGLIDVLRYPDGNDAEENVVPDALAEGVYARVHGPVRLHQNTRHVIGFKVEQVEDPNIITSHMLEVILQRIKLKKFAEQGEEPSTSSGAVLQNSSLQNIPNVSAGGGLGSEKDMVFAAIKSTTSDAGMSRAEIKSILAGKMSAEKVERLVEELSTDGIIYTTLDDDHFQVIEA